MRHMFGRTFMLGVLTAGLAVAPALAADAVPPRVEGLKRLGEAFKKVNDELKAKTPQLDVIQLAAGQIRDASKAQYDWFPAGSGPQPGLKTSAKPAIWERPAEFKAAQDALATQATAFQDAASSGDLDKIRAQAKQLGEACGDCHHTFRTMKLF